MIIDAIKYARARLVALGYREWREGFNFRNIPRTEMTRTFHIELGDVQGAGADHRTITMQVPITVRLFEPGDRASLAVRDACVTKADTTIAAFVLTTNRVTFPGVKTVVLDKMAVEQLDETNDNGAIIKLDFAATVVISTE